MSDRASPQAAGELVRRAMALSQERALDVQARVKRFYETARSHTRELEEVSEQLHEAGREQLTLVSGRVEKQQERMIRLAEEVKAQTGAAQDAVASTAQLNRTATVLESIALESRLLSVNAKVEAASMAEDGRSIQVIASAVRDLSNTLRTYADGLEGIVHGVDRAMPLLASQSEVLQQETADARTDLDALTSEVTRGHERFVGMISEHLDAGRAHASTIQEDAHDLLSLSQCFDEVVQMLNAALIHLDTGHADPNVGTPPRLLEESPSIDQESELEEDLLFL